MPRNRAPLPRCSRQRRAYVHSLLNPVTTGKIKTKKKSSINARKPKYEFLDENGEIQTWSGNGKPPTVLQKLLDDGNELEEFLIKN
ncbi:H-NS family nucleoid-associated regulatory protein [Arsenophonus nasoniae]|uniref:H-NS family nucleoid-associated regulatory protein n=1 Tax=Arsenophonus nasoniae TaxID=638 RepID=UPI003879138D